MDFAQGVGTFQAVVLSVQEIFVGVSGGGGGGGGRGGRVSLFWNIYLAWTSHEELERSKQ